MWSGAAVYLAGVFILAVLLLGWRAALAYLRLRGMRLVTCPENTAAAAVEVDAKHAALSVAIDGLELQLKNCSRWPERHGCGQTCLAEIEASPDDCLLRTILTRWYKGKSCVYCGRAFGKLNWPEHKPAVVSPEHITFEWDELRADSIPEVLATHLPVCWNCHIAETFRRLYPYLVTDRSWKSAGRASSPTN